MTTKRFRSSYGEWVNKSDSVGEFWNLIGKSGNPLATVYRDGSATLYLTIERTQSYTELTSTASSVEEGMQRVEHLLTELAALRFEP